MTPRPGIAQFTGSLRQADDFAFAEQCAGKGEPASTFFPEPGQSATKRAFDLCGGCPVRGECLDYALTHDEPYGIWGGFTANARRTMKQARKRAERVKR